MASGNYFGSNGQIQPDILSAGRQFNAQTISSGAITYTYTLVNLSSESGTTDDLTTISSANAGDVIIIKAASTHTITAKTTGNIALAADYAISGDVTLSLAYDGTAWLPIGASSLTVNGLSLTVNDGSTTVNDVTQIEFDDLTVTDDGSGKVSISGAGGTPGYDGALLYRSTNQSIPVATNTAISWTGPVHDTNSYWAGGNPTRLAAPAAGYYSVFGFGTVSTNSSWVMKISKNGGTFYYAQFINSEALGNAPSAFVQTHMLLSASDYLELIVYVNGGAKNFLGSTTAHINGFGMQFLGT